MRFKMILSFCGLLIICTMLFGTAESYGEKREIDEITQAIQQNKSRWSVKDNNFSKLTTEERKKRLGSQLPIFSSEAKILDVPSAPLPFKLDWRNYNNDNYITPVKEQGACGACWAFATTAALESKVLISQNTPGMQLDLSEQLLTSCSGAGTCTAGSINAASDFLCNFGLPPEYFYPYTASDGLCATVGSDWVSSAYKIPGWSLVNPTVSSIKSALYTYGPLVSLMAVQTDFYYYGSGIYTYSWGSFEGYHAALIVGYDDIEQYFIVKSSWGTDWGENGYFRIAYSELNTSTIFARWTLAYNAVIPTDFPLVDGIQRDAKAQGKEETGNSTNDTGNHGQSDDASGSGADNNQGNDKSNIAGTSTLTGTVKDGSGKIISGVEIKAGKFTTTTNDNGKYLLTSLTAGDYVVTAGKKGYTIASASVSIPLNATVSKNFILTPDKTSADFGQITSPGPRATPAEHISRTATRNYYASKLKSSSNIPLAAAEGDPPEPEKELLELARALRNDPEEIFQYVLNNIDYVPYHGALKGALLTYLDGSGNDFDQASLLIALLRASGINQFSSINHYNPQYAFRDFYTNYYDLTYWVGLSPFTQKDLLPHVFDSGGISYDADQYGYFYALDRVLVKATTGTYDPAWKKYTYISDTSTTTPKLKMDCSNPSNICTAMTYDVGEINQDNVISMLQTYSEELVKKFRSDNYANSDLKEIIGGRSIEQANASNALRIDDLQWPGDASNKPSCWPNCTTVPEIFVTKLIIQYGQSVYTLRTPELNGRRLIFTPTATDHGLRLDDGDALNPGGVGPTIGANTLAISVDHPYAASCDTNDDGLPESGCYADTSRTYKVVNGGTYAIVYNFGGTSVQLMRIRQDQLDSYITRQESSKALGEALNVMGLTWLQEHQMANKLLSRLAGTIHVHHHQVGLMAQETKIADNISVPYHFIDIRNDYRSIIGGTLTDHTPEFAHLYTEALIGSALEHSILEQMQMLNNSRKPGVSTTKLFQIAKDNGKQIHLVDASNFDAISQLFSNYGSDDLTAITNKINISPTIGAYTFILPELPQDEQGVGYLTLNTWKGKGYISIFKHNNGSYRIGMIIGDGYHGGFIADPLPVDANWVSVATEKDVKYNFGDASTATFRALDITALADPVDMASGAYLYEHTDLGLGSAAPLGLSFTRFYDSRLAKKKGALGYGWTHNYESSLGITSDFRPAFGARQPVDAASLIAALYVIFDLMKTPNIQSWVTASLISNWAVDQIVDNAVTVLIGNKAMEFIKLADGTYASPPGITTQLIKNPDGTFSLLERFGTSINFNSSRRIANVRDADGNTKTFNYTGSNLTSVSDDTFGRSLTFDYSVYGDKIGSVTELAGSVATGRKVSYGYIGGDLAYYTDPASKIWTYDYCDDNVCDGNHLLKKLLNPLEEGSSTKDTAVKNTYDRLGRVKTQEVPRKIGDDETIKVYDFYFSGYKNQQVDPDGNKMTFFYDETGREVKVTDQLTKSVTRKYDGQNHMTEITDPRSLNYKTKYTYDGNHNLKKITYPATEPATQPTKEINYGYNDPNFSYHLTDTYLGTNLGDDAALTPRTRFDYKGTHHIKDTYQYLDNNNDDNKAVHTSIGHDTNGLVKDLTDGNRKVTKIVDRNYDSPHTVKTGNYDPIIYNYDSIGRMRTLTDQADNTTSFEYDGRNLLTSITHPQFDDTPAKTTTYNYYNSGKLKSKTDRNDVTIGYQYTNSGKLEYITYPDSGKNVHFSYNGNANDTRDNVTSMQDSVGTTSYTEYDAANRLKTMKYSYATNPQVEYIIYYEYDDAGNVTKITYPGTSKSVSYTYDELNRMKTVKLNWLGANNTLTYFYDAAGRIDLLTHFNNAIVVDYGYDKANRLTSMENRNGTNVIVSYTFTLLDGNGNRREVTKTEPLSPMQGTAATSYAYNIKRNRLESTTTEEGSFRYDKEGQLDSGYNTAYEFDFEHRLISIGTTYQFSYDGKGNRRQAIRDNTTTRYLYDAGGNVIAEVNGSDNSITCYYIYGQGLLAMVTAAGEIYYYHYDATGNTVAMTNQSGTIVNKYAYDPFGNILAEEEFILQSFKYVGQYGVMAEPNGFYYMRARYYDPKVGRFISEDPIGFDGGDVNLYAYVQNNPVNGIDPNGLKLVETTLPGLGRTYLDDSFIPMVQAWINNNSQSGLSVTFTSAFRPTSVQQSLQSNPTATTPATPGSSLHEAGFAVDISWTSLNSGQRNTAVTNASSAGLNWGGNFRTPDPVHFYYDPGNRAARISQAQQEYRNLTGGCGH